MWPVLVPLAGLALTIRVQPHVRAQRITRLAFASRLLWRDYEVGTSIYWETIETLRKLTLTCFLLLVDTAGGSSKLFRLAIAASVSAAYLAVLALARPFRQRDDLFLACASNLLLTCVFISGAVLHICNEGDAACDRFIGLGLTERTAAVAFVLLTAALLLLAVLAILAKVLAAVTSGAQTVRVVSTGREPVLELPRQCRHHVFMSHVWGTGQDQTHTVVRQLQALLPRLDIWLDVDRITDMGELEEQVAASAVMVVFLSRGYFASHNCRRELYAALASNRPIVTLREADLDKGGATVAELQQELLHTDSAHAGMRQYRPVEDVLAGVFAQEPLLWVRVRAFQMVTMRLLAEAVLCRLPYYLSHPGELRAGIRVSGEITTRSSPSTPVRVYICSANDGAKRLADELAAAGAGAVAAVTVQEVDEILTGQNVACACLLLYLTQQVFAYGQLYIPPPYPRRHLPSIYSISYFLLPPRYGP
jgi:hypothetical protein